MTNFRRIPLPNGTGRISRSLRALADAQNVGQPLRSKDALVSVTPWGTRVRPKPSLQTQQEPEESTSDGGVWI